MKIQNVIATIPINNVDRVKKFYSQILGFTIETLSSELNMFWVYANKNRFLLYQREDLTKAEHTVISFSVSNIQESINELENEGILFFEEKGNKIFNLDGSLSAWFQDTEGNNLEISQRIK